MNIIRVVGSPEGKCPMPGRIISTEITPDKVIVQDKSAPISFNNSGALLQEEWKLIPKDIYRYSIDGKAELVTRKTIDGERVFVENARNVCIGSAYEGKLVFSITPQERILGLGQHEDGISNYRNCTQHLYQNNMQIPMPVFVSTNNYAVVLDAECLMIYKEKDNKITITLDAAERIDYYVIQGQSLEEVGRGIRKLTGKAPLLPLWAYGYIQSRERYKTQEQVLEIAEEFKKRKIPVSCLVQDWMTWEEGKWGNKRLDKKRFPNVKEMTEKLHKEGIAYMFSVWPNMNKGCEDNQEMLDAGKLYANLSTYDAFDEEARQLYWKQCEREIYSGGTDAWWCDSTEPFTPDWGGIEKKSDTERYELAKESLTKYMDARQANSFALCHAKGMHDNQRKSASYKEKRVVNLTRSGYPSIQKYGAILWSGDIMATWDIYRKQIIEGLQMSASGIPYWTLDIGAFFTGNLNAWKRFSGAQEGAQPWFWHGLYEDGVADKGYCELYVRWLQYGTFLPVMRSHGTDTPREPWNFEKSGQVYYDTILKYIQLRYRLLPYIYSLANRIYEEDAAMMGWLVFSYQGDKKAEGITDEYLFGDFLVCPVTSPMEYVAGNVRIEAPQTREVYLPKGNGWYDYESGQWYPGGTALEAAAPVSKMPLYIRDGSILTINRDTSGCNLYEEQRPEEIGIEIFAGRDGQFTYYLDQGNGYGYQKGDKTEICLEWKENEQILCIGKAEGTYGYPEKITIRLHKQDGGIVEKETAYSGEKTFVSFVPGL